MMQESMKRPGRPRSAAVHQAILMAALALANERPYAEVTMEAIAARAGVGKQTLYRWWPSKAEIILEALASSAAADIPVPDTGHPLEDLRLFLRTTFHILNTRTNHIVRLLMAEAQLDPGFAAAFYEGLIARRRAALLSILTRFNEADTQLLADLIYGAMWYRLLVGHAPLDDACADALVARLFADNQVAPGRE